MNLYPIPESNPNPTLTLSLTHMLKCRPYAEVPYALSKDRQNKYFYTFMTSQEDVNDTSMV